MMENPFDEQQNKIQRPTFLLVLCILTFIGSGWSVLSNLFSLFTSEMMDSMMEVERYSSMINGAASENNAYFSNILSAITTTLQATFEHARAIYMINLVLNVIGLLGAILMFQLRRFGFYLYAAAQILLLFVLPYFAGFNFYVLGLMFFSGIVTLLFIILYGVNLKHMTR